MISPHSPPHLPFLSGKQTSHPVAPLQGCVHRDPHRCRHRTPRFCRLVLLCPSCVGRGGKVRTLCARREGACAVWNVAARGSRLGAVSHRLSLPRVDLDRVKADSRRRVRSNT